LTSPLRVVYKPGMARKSSRRVKVSDDLPTVEEFWSWATTIPIASRDTGLGPIKPWGTQRHLIDEIFLGLREGQHQFLVAKAGQVGATLVLHLLTIYMMLRYPGLQGTLVADGDEVRDFCRDNLIGMATNAPEPIDTRLNNRQMIGWVNGSRLLLQTAGPRTGRKLGVGRGVAFIHGTEVPLWAHDRARGYLLTRFSDNHPQRIAIFEGTSRGKNWWYDAWHDAGDASDIRRIFLASWMREDNTLKEDSAEFRQYWDSRLTTREQHWAKEIRRRYHVEITDGQWAWRRWYAAEKMDGDEKAADQEMPMLVEDSFEASGISFLTSDALRVARRSVRAATTPERWRYEWGSHIEDTDVHKTIPGRDVLQVWEQAKSGEGYVIAAVPAHSTAPGCPDFAATVWRASRDELVQVAEFSDQTCGLQAFSWVCAHLIGAYRTPRRAFILEIVGLGGAVLEEMKRLQASGWGTHNRPSVTKALGGVHHYMWRRPDTFGGGARQWKSNLENRQWLYSRLRDQLARGAVLIRSEKVLDELERLRQVDDTFVAEGKHAGEHHVMAAALAVEAWAAQLVPLFQRVQGQSSATTVTERAVANFFMDLNAKVEAGGRR
jgi:hypothetical protein